MRIGIVFLFLFMIGVQVGIAQTRCTLSPVPQQVVWGNGSITLPTDYQLIGDNIADPFAVEQLKELLQTTPNQSAQFSIFIGKRGDKAVKKYTRMIPQFSEGYYLLVDRNKIVLAGNDSRGTYYAVQTFAQLLQDGKLPTVEIKDYPTIRFRGVVEGFYGTPWSHKARIRQLQFYGQNKMNTYIYGPKDDPYHSCPNWRKPYPAGEAKQIEELVKVARKNHVDFVWAIHPGQDIKWSDADRELLMAKFESMYQLGVRSFAVFFDDISGEGTDPVRQAELLNYLDNQFVKVKGDVTPLIMCPTEYNKSWSNPAKGYLTTLGTQLNPSVQVMWTGDRVISDMTQEGLAWINEKIKRPAYIWWNFPVSDYVRDHLLMGEVYGNYTNVKGEMAGFVTNPMENAEASKIAIFCVADYAWNPAKYSSYESWIHAMEAILPQDADALKVFASHNSDLGANVHGYRREESVQVQPLVGRFAEQVKKGDCKGADLDSLQVLFSGIIEAADILLVNPENKDLIQEIQPWLYQFKLLGETGNEVLEMLKAEQAGNKELFLRKYRHVKALQQQSFLVDQTYNQNPYQPGVKTGSKVLQPLIDNLFATTTERFNEKEGMHLDATVKYAPHHLTGNVPQFKNLPLQIKNNQILVTPMLEVIKWGKGEYLMIETDKEYPLQRVELDFGRKEIDWSRVEVSLDGKNWTSISFTQKNNQFKAETEGIQMKFIRITNSSDQEQQIHLRKLILVIQK